MDALPSEGLPPGWAYAPLGEVLPLQYGKALAADLRNEAGIVPVYGSAGRTGTHDQALTHGPTIIVGRKGNAGAVHLVEQPCWPIDTVYYTNDLGVLDLRLAAYLLEYVRLDKLDQSTAVPSLSRDVYSRVVVPIAPRAEQARIVAAVNALFEEVEAGQAALTRAREGLTQFRASLLHAACTGALTADWRATNSPAETGADLLCRTASSARSQEVARLWEAPATWAWTNVGSAGQVDLGRQRAPQHHEGPHMRPYLRVANVMEDRLDLRDVKWMNFDPAEFTHYSLRPGDILLNEGQSPDLIGRPAIYNGEIDGCCFQKTLLRFRAGPCCTTDFAQIVFLHYLHAGEFRKLAPITTNMAHLTRVRFVEMPFPVPPLEEQEAIVVAVRSAFDAMSAESLAAVGEPVPALRQSILHAAFTGRLVPQDPADEPAAALLARLHATPAAARRPRARRTATQPDLIETPA